MDFIKKMTIKKKLTVPVYFQVALLVVLMIFFINIRGKVKKTESQQMGMVELSAKIRQLSDQKESFLRGDLSLEELERTIMSIRNQIGGMTLQRLNALDGSLETAIANFKEISDRMKQNSELEKEIFSLLDVSINQSNQYIAQTVARLADPARSNSVSILERQVIAAANQNTNSNNEIKILFFRMKEDVKQADMLESFLTAALKNASATRERLKNTPFAKMPEESEKALSSIQKSAFTYKGNFNRINDLSALIQQGTTAFHKEIETINMETTSGVFSSFMTQLLALFLFVLIISALIILVSVTMTRMIVRPITQTRDMLGEISSGEGDLRGRLKVDGNDEIANMSKNYNRFADQVEMIIQNVKSSTVEVLNATREIATSSSDLASRTTEQASVTTETSATIEEFTAVVRSNTEHAANLNVQLSQLNTEMQGNMALVNEVTETMTEIYQSSKQIDNIVDVINDISFQTNLLALNAAVEAARAGEAGRGFAVVASEVRNLAQKTAESSKSIQAIVTGNVKATAKGTELVKKTSDLLVNVIKALQDAVEKIGFISHSSQEQNDGIQQISNSVIQIDEVTNQNAALVEELSATSSSMETVAKQLQELVGRFKTSEDVDSFKMEAKKPSVPKKDVKAPAKTPAAVKIPEPKKAPELKKTPVAPKTTVAPKAPVAPKVSEPKKEPEPKKAAEPKKAPPSPPATPSKMKETEKKAEKKEKPGKTEPGKADTVSDLDDFFSGDGFEEF